jgi:hypothetical protein
MAGKAAQSPDTSTKCCLQLGWMRQTAHEGVNRQQPHDAQGTVSGQQQNDTMHQEQRQALLSPSRVMASAASTQLLRPKQ